MLTIEGRNEAGSCDGGVSWSPGKQKHRTVIGIETHPKNKWDSLKVKSHWCPVSH